MNASTELHNLLSGRFVREIVGPAIKGGASSAELMVLFETMQVGMMEVLNRHYELAPSAAVTLCEESLQQAIERFAGMRKPGSAPK